jgi:hypothetical protein
MLYVYLFWVGLCQHFWNGLVWLDQGLNWFLLLGDPDETISSVTAKNWRRCRFFAWLRRLLNWVDPGHTEKSLEPNEGKNSVWAAVARAKAKRQAKRE